jgi:cell division protein ZipA
MENTQLILLVIAGLIVLCVVVFATRKKYVKQDQYHDDVVEHENDEDDLPHILNEETELDQDTPIEEDNKSPEKKASSAQDDFMMLSVHAKPGRLFADYDFLQTIGLAGLVYGDHKIFHYDVKTDIGMQRLFSVAQLNNPGTFDVDHVENIACKGLLMFIDLHACRKQVLALDCMLESAYQLAEDLDGIMFEGYNTPWQEDTPRALAQKLEQYQKNLASVLDEVTY